MEKNAKAPFVVLRTEENVSCREALRLVRQSLRGQGETPWRFMELEIFSGTGGSLVIARPRREERLYISVSALQVLANRK